LVENICWLLSHDGGKTLQSMIGVFKELGYHIFEPKVLKAIYHRVP